MGTPNPPVRRVGHVVVVPELYPRSDAHAELVGPPPQLPPELRGTMTPVADAVFKEICGPLSLDELRAHRGELWVAFQNSIRIAVEVTHLGQMMIGERGWFQGIHYEDVLASKALTHSRQIALEYLQSVFAPGYRAIDPENTRSR